MSAETKAQALIASRGLWVVSVRGPPIIFAPTSADGQDAFNSSVALISNGCEATVAPWQRSEWVSGHP
jgi:hypothetical protein